MNKALPARARTFTAARAAIAFLFALHLAACPVNAEDTTGFKPATSAKEAEDLHKAMEKLQENIVHVESAQPGIKLSGYVEASYTNQFASRNENGPASTEQAMRGEFHNNDFNINVFKLVLEKQLSEDRSTWSVGFRTDIFWGEDALSYAPNDPAVTANDLYLQQAYLSVRVPVGRGLEISVGKITCFIGYEADERPSNINFSYGLVGGALESANSTGIQFGYPVTDTVRAMFTIADGWDASDVSPRAPGVIRNGKAISGQLLINSTAGNAYIAPTFLYCTEGAPLYAGPTFQENEPLFLGEVYGQWQPKCVPDNRLTLAFDAVFATASSGTDSLLGAPRDDTSTWWGLALYARYRFNPVFSLGARTEYIHSDDSAKFLGGAIPGPGGPVPIGELGSSDVYSATVTAGFDIWQNVLTRIEYRYDRGPDNIINGTDEHQLAVDITYSF